MESAKKVMMWDNARIDGQTYALKIIKLVGLDEKDRKNTLNEVRILASLHHPHILRKGYFTQLFEMPSLILKQKSSAS